MPRAPSGGQGLRSGTDYVPKGRNAAGILLPPTDSRNTPSGGVGELPDRPRGPRGAAHRPGEADPVTEDEIHAGYDMLLDAREAWRATLPEEPTQD